jgi:hypothetical protein
MRMKNPFSGDSEEEKDSGEEPRQEAPEEPAQETRVSETSASDQPRSNGADAENGANAGESDSGERSESGEASESGEQSDSGEQELTAPSVGPHTVIEKEPPEERLDFDKISDTDAMGKDKRREVVGGSYGPTKTRVFATFAAFFLVVGALAAGFYFLAKELDQPPASNPDLAPWSQAGAPQQPPKEIQ